MTSAASQLIDRHARRMVIENAISDAIDFFHMDALSASVPMKINPDLQFTLMASALYRLLVARIGIGKEHAKPRTLFRNFIKVPAVIRIGEDIIEIRSSTLHDYAAWHSVSTMRRILSGGTLSLLYLAAGPSSA